MSEDLVAEIMKVEGDASKIKAEAKAQADSVVEAAGQVAASIRELVVADAHKQAEEIVERGRQAADAERARLLAAAQQDVTALETRAAENIEAAVMFVVRQVLGRE